MVAGVGVAMTALLAVAVAFGIVVTPVLLFDELPPLCFPHYAGY